jgi:hypothetical protein
MQPSKLAPVCRKLCELDHIRAAVIGAPARTGMLSLRRASEAVSPNLPDNRSSHEIAPQEQQAEAPQRADEVIE